MFKGHHLMTSRRCSETGLKASPYLPVNPCHLNRPGFPESSLLDSRHQGWGLLGRKLCR